MNPSIRKECFIGLGRAMTHWLIHRRDTNQWCNYERLPSLLVKMHKRLWAVSQSETEASSRCVVCGGGSDRASACSSYCRSTPVSRSLVAADALPRRERQRIPQSGLLSRHHDKAPTPPPRCAFATRAPGSSPGGTVARSQGRL